jgi:DNA-directed RNA polymerase subunit RPC12/RpoP
MAKSNGKKKIKQTDGMHGATVCPACRRVLCPECAGEHIEDCWGDYSLKKIQVLCETESHENRDAFSNWKAIERSPVTGRAFFTIVCPGCRRTKILLGRLRNHFIKEGIQQGMPCANCSKLVPVDSLFNLSKGEKETRWLCERCGFRLGQNNLLFELTDRCPNKQFACPDCGHALLVKDCHTRLVSQRARIKDEKKHQVQQIRKLKKKKAKKPKPNAIRKTRLAPPPPSPLSPIGETSKKGTEVDPRDYQANTLDNKYAPSHDPDKPMSKYYDMPEIDFDR